MNIHEEKWHHSRTNTGQHMDIHIPYNITTNETNHTTQLMTAFCDKHIRSILNSSTEIVKQWSSPNTLRCVCGGWTVIYEICGCWVCADAGHHCNGSYWPLAKFRVLVVANRCFVVGFYLTILQSGWPGCHNTNRWDSRRVCRGPLALIPLRSIV